IVGRLFREFALTVTASIAVSALVSLTLAPMLCGRVMRGGSHAAEGWFKALLAFYARTLDIVLRHQRATMGVFIAVLALTAVMAVQIPKGFFPIQDIGVVQGLAEAGQDISPEEMMRLQREIGEVLLKDPDIAAFQSNTGGVGVQGFAQTPNTARFNIGLKPRSERTSSATDVIDRLRPQMAKIKGVTLAMNAVQ